MKAEGGSVTRLLLPLLNMTIPAPNDLSSVEFSLASESSLGSFMCVMFLTTEALDGEDITVSTTLSLAVTWVAASADMVDKSPLSDVTLCLSPLSDVVVSTSSVELTATVVLAPPVAECV